MNSIIEDPIAIGHDANMRSSFLNILSLVLIAATAIESAYGTVRGFKTVQLS